MRVAGWALSLLALAYADNSESAELRRLETKKVALEMEKKLVEFTQQLRQVSMTSDSEVFKTIAGFADEGDSILERARQSESDEEKIMVLEEGLAKRKEWVQVLSDAKDSMEDEQREDAEIDAEVDVDSEDDADPDAMIHDVAKLFQKSVREGNVKVMLDFMNALSKTPATLTKILNYRDSVGATVLHWCAFYGTEAHIALAKVFVKVPGVDTTLQDNHNHTACSTACMKGHHEVLDLLLKSATPCDPMMVSSEGMHCAHYAARQGNEPMMRLLQPLLTPDNVDLYTNSTRDVTPLYFATESSSEEIIKILLEAGASSDQGMRLRDGTVETCKQKAQLDLAKQVSIVKMLAGVGGEARSEL